ncbi:hypothetical protein KIN20_014353 [Parelaphostrongylus tenuis]|uniref:Uncharacterized protein n=1 Tax=Parelaphostrongylus tenuis TaxID=148309 RepID=A0AAD5QP90_PARTN|nr:hypothetical protein KIN20_014353 [Parelaphostrongylus tenuis]
MEEVEEVSMDFTRSHLSADAQEQERLSKTAPSSSSHSISGEDHHCRRKKWVGPIGRRYVCVKTDIKHHSFFGYWPYITA